MARICRRGGTPDRNSAGCRRIYFAFFGGGAVPVAAGSDGLRFGLFAQPMPVLTASLGGRGGDSFEHSAGAESVANLAAAVLRPS